MAEGIEKTPDKTVVNFVNDRLWAVQGRELAPVSYTQLVTALVGRRKVASVNKKPTDLSLAKSRLISHVTVQGYPAWASLHPVTQEPGFFQQVTLPGPPLYPQHEREETGHEGLCRRILQAKPMSNIHHFRPFSHMAHQITKDARKGSYMSRRKKKWETLSISATKSWLILRPQCLSTLSLLLHFQRYS